MRCLACFTDGKVAGQACVCSGSASVLVAAGTPAGAVAQPGSTSTLLSSGIKPVGFPSTGWVFTLVLPPWAAPAADMMLHREMKVPHPAALLALLRACAAVPSLHSGSSSLEGGSPIPNGFISQQLQLGQPQEGDHWPRWVVTTTGRVGDSQPDLSPLPPSPHPAGFCSHPQGWARCSRDAAPCQPSLPEKQCSCHLTINTN